LSTAWAARSGGSFAIALSIREGISSRVDEEAVAVVWQNLLNYRAHMHLSLPIDF